MVNWTLCVVATSLSASGIHGKVPRAPTACPEAIRAVGAPDNKAPAITEALIAKTLRRSGALIQARPHRLEPRWCPVRGRRIGSRA
jgi:hypothetical protein